MFRNVFGTTERCNALHPSLEWGWKEPKGVLLLHRPRQLLLFVVLMAWPTRCHAALQKGSSLTKTEILKAFSARAGKDLRPALTETDDIHCVLVCQVRYIQGDSNFRQLSSCFTMDLAWQKEQKESAKGRQMFLTLLDNKGEAEAHRNRNPWGSAPGRACATPRGDAALASAPRVFFIVCDTKLRFQITLVRRSEQI